MIVPFSAHRFRVTEDAAYEGFLPDDAQLLNDFNRISSCKLYKHLSQSLFRSLLQNQSVQRSFCICK